ncbi:hypothetical protein SAMN04489730_2067 [Amycolatopsis australiensis]|uniref:Uncharacterized protein n=2 Tax=Amycolatopsis australiensis TaxID=546364 RepID=A0A1K1QRN0_9PSEU|nr:hypothetical protein SAMN04489730_2067 [Amycolatopsis australiensis]
MAAGLDLDRRHDLLFVADGNGGKASVYDAGNTTARSPARCSTAATRPAYEVLPSARDW